MWDETKPISATDIVNNPELITGLLQEYIFVKDASTMGTYKNLIAAINILSEYGWESLSIGGDAANNFYALVRNTHYKSKNIKEDS